MLLFACFRIALVLILIYDNVTYDLLEMSDNVTYDLLEMS